MIWRRRLGKAVKKADEKAGQEKATEKRMAIERELSWIRIQKSMWQGTGGWLALLLSGSLRGRDIIIL